MQPLFFGRKEQQLYGTYHEPAESNGFNQCSVLICPSVGEEYATMHWALLRLARMLAIEGFHVLRFDYSGTGDSAGEFVDVTASDWTDDILTADRELRHLSGNQRVVLLGVRFGTLLVVHAARQLQANSVVVWEPVWCGAQFIDSLRQGQKRLERRYAQYRKSRISLPTEFVGFTFSEACLSSMEDLHLDVAINADYGWASITSVPDERVENLVTSLSDAGRSTTHYNLDEAEWLDGLNRFERIQVPNAALGAVRNALSTLG